MQVVQIWNWNQWYRLFVGLLSRSAAYAGAASKTGNTRHTSKLSRAIYFYDPKVLGLPSDPFIRYLVDIRRHF